jgi:TolB-like protein/Tfp pilus assembly protein PilF
MTTPPDIFLSYNREDQARAKLFAEAFEAQDFKVWWDVGLRTGEAYDEVTETALRTAKAVVVLWSKKSVQSRWVRAEATLADRNKTLVPCMIEPCERPIMFELTQTAELSHWVGSPTDNAWVTFLSDLQRLIRRENLEPIPTAPLAVPPLLPTKPSIAVLPFLNMSNDPGQSYLADGMMEEVNNALTRIPMLFVIASGSARGRIPGGDFRELGRELGVRYLLDGSVQKSSARLRISVKLIDATKNAQIWTNRFDGSMDEVFDFQDAVARDVAGMIDSALLKAELGRANQRATDNPDAYDLYLQGFGKTLSWDQSSVETGVALLERAINIDPEFAEALALLAFGWHQIAVADWRRQAEQARAKAIDYGRRAVRISPDNPRVLSWVGVTLMGLGEDVRDAERLIERAIEICPGSPFNLLAGSWIKAVQGQFEPAVKRLQEGRRLDPVSIYAAYIHLGLGVAYFANGDLDDAIEHIKEAVHIWPEYPSARGFECAALFNLGRVADARASFASVPRALEAAMMLMRAPRGTELLQATHAALVGESSMT